MALDLVEVACKAGANAVKFQLFNPVEQISANSHTAEYQRKATGKVSMLEMAKDYDLPWEDHIRIKQHCDALGIMYMSSCFDKDAIDFYKQIGGKILKIASGEITNLELLSHAAKSELPLILSTGMSTLPEVSDAIHHIKRIANSTLALLHCVSRYPTPLAELNLNFMTTMRVAFGSTVGFSDHTDNLSTGSFAVILGARIIEKHFTLDRNLSGPDHEMSCSPESLTEYIRRIREAEVSLGKFHKQFSPEEIEIRNVARRSIVATKNLQIGHTLTSNDLTLKRPGTGINPVFMPHLIGRKLTRSIMSDQQLSWDDL
jgi:sialic acid synthase SpsE